MKKTYATKIKFIKSLSHLDLEKITNEEIKNAANKVGLSQSIAKYTWRNFLETGGKVDLSIKHPKYSTDLQLPQSERNATKKRNISSKDAGKIIKKWMNVKTNKVTINDFCAQEDISTAQYYEWIHELNVSGKLLGRTVLNPAKYAKLNIKDLIWMQKFPKTERKSITSLTELERDAYNRCYTVFRHRL